MRYKLAVFDMDGTILNTLEDLADSTNYALKANGLPERTIDEVRRFVGNGIRLLIERAVPADSEPELVDEVFETFKKYYKTHCAVKTRPYDGIKEVLVSLRKSGCLTAVVSNKADFAVQDLCKDYFDGLFGVFADSLPDNWGRLLLNRLLRAHGQNPDKLTVLERLAIVGKSGMGALTYYPEKEMQEKQGHSNLDELAEQCQKLLNTEYSDKLDCQH